jgi:hypothetical protein
MNAKALTNQQVANDARLAGITILAVGNLHDLMWRPTVYFGIAYDFWSTQYLTDESAA